MRTPTPHSEAMDIETKIEEIRERWADCSWPKIGYFVHGQARDDIAMLLAIADCLLDAERGADKEINRLREAVRDTEEYDRREDAAS